MFFYDTTNDETLDEHRKDGVSHIVGLLNFDRKMWHFLTLFRAAILIAIDESKKMKKVVHRHIALRYSVHCTG